MVAGGPTVLALPSPGGAGECGVSSRSPWLALGGLDSLLLFDMFDGMSDPPLTICYHLAACLSETNVAFHDLYWSTETDQIRKHHVPTAKLVKLVRSLRLRLIIKAGQCTLCK